jgi:fumarate reductase subunit D
MEDERQKLINWILKIAVGSLASIMIAVVLALLVALFVPNEMVDNKDIFPIIGPAFNTVIGAFVGLLGGLSLSNGEKKEEPKAEEPPPAPSEPEDEIA